MKEKIKEEITSILTRNKEKEGMGNINIHKTRELLMDAGAILLDVRPPAKVKGENAEEAGIADAYYTPYPKFNEYLDSLPTDHSAPIVVACLKGWFASRIMGYLEMIEYNNVYVLADNIEELIEVHHAHADK